ncbi:response regulator [Fodinicola acaciae]|uniref:response regulator n=1 Tax=Fodinicola acaciae TaxID=2681555 RepID=UPI0013D60ACC|nr:response regulator transcription factor [Fodinicola acaciae]
MIRVLVVDDQQLMREGLVALLDMLDDVEVVGNAGNGRDALARLAETPADVVLMDLRMPVLDGVDTTKQISARYPETAVLVLTTYDDDSSIAAALQAGARGYLTKDAGRVEIAAAVRSAAAGQSTFDPAVSARLVAALSRAEPAKRELPDGLTEREGQILALIGRGLSNAEIAAQLFIGQATVKTHINNAFAKIGARNRADATRYAYDHDLS